MKEGVIDIEAIKVKIKDIVYQTTNIKPEDIDDDAGFVEDLELDSLTLLEIAINVDQEFDLQFPEEEMGKLTTVSVSADLVVEYLEKKAAKA